jgi:ABC-type uncharacterized transport system fused permease/ATPase subunit
MCEDSFSLSLSLTFSFSFSHSLLYSGSFLTYLRRPASRMTVVEQEQEGNFRYVNARLITNSEEVAFYQVRQVCSCFLRCV